MLPEVTHKNLSVLVVLLLPITKRRFFLKLQFYWWLSGIWNFNNTAVCNDHCTWLLKLNTITAFNKAKPQTALCAAKGCGTFMCSWCLKLGPSWLLRAVEI